MRRRLLFTLLGSISWGVICAPARAQVNVEVLRADLKESGFGAKLDASLESYLGNTQGSTLGAEALVGLAADRHLAYLSARGDHSHLGHETQVSQAFLHARYNLRLWSWVWGEVFGQIESDRFRRIALRELLGIGPRFELLDTDTVAVYYGAAYMLEHTRLRPGTERVEGRPDIVHRFSNYAAIAANFDGERMVLSQTVYYQPRFDDFGDWRLLTSTGLDFDLSGPFTAGISATFRFEDPTPSSVQRADFTLHNTFGVEL